jgi:hypothetical protein
MEQAPAPAVQPPLLDEPLADDAPPLPLDEALIEPEPPPALELLEPLLVEVPPSPPFDEPELPVPM